jgi:hypothetical protein
MPLHSFSSLHAACTKAENAPFFPRAQNDGDFVDNLSFQNCETLILVIKGESKPHAAGMQVSFYRLKDKDFGKTKGRRLYVVMRQRPITQSKTFTIESIDVAFHHHIPPNGSGPGVQRSGMKSNLRFRVSGVGGSKVQAFKERLQSFSPER